MKYYLFLLIVFFGPYIFSQNQKIEFVFHQNQYLLGDQFYDYKELKPHFEKFPNSKKEYQKFKNLKVLGNVLLVGGLTLTVAGIAKPTSDEDGCDTIFCPANEDKAVTLVSGILITLAGTFAGIYNASVNKQSPIDFYNWNIENNLGAKESKLDWRLAAVKNGIGIQLNF